MTWKRIVREIPVAGLFVGLGERLAGVYPDRMRRRMALGLVLMTVASGPLLYWSREQVGVCASLVTECSDFVPTWLVVQLVMIYLGIHFLNDAIFAHIPVIRLGRKTSGKDEGPVHDERARHDRSGVVQRGAGESEDTAKEDDSSERRESDIKRSQSDGKSFG